MSGRSADGRTSPAPVEGHGLHLLMRTALRGCQADFALVALRVDDDRLIIQAGVGPLAEDMIGNLMLVRDSVAAQVLDDGRPLLVADYPQRGGADPPVRAQIGSVVVVPLDVAGRTEGALAVGRLVEHEPLNQFDLNQLAAFVERTGTARELQDAHEERRTARMLEDRMRVRDDLHDNVIQEIFAAGIALQLAAESTSDRDLRDRILAQVDALHATTGRIRMLINDLPASDPDAALLPLPKRVIAIVDSLTPALGALPTVGFAGPVDSSVDPQLGSDLEAVLREALSNVARHAAATSVQVRISVAEGRLDLEVIDDGCGIGSSTRSSGLTNIRRRAARHNGHLHLSVPDGGGTHLKWSVELADGRA